MKYILTSLVLFVALLFADSAHATNFFRGNRGFNRGFNVQLGLFGFQNRQRFQSFVNRNGDVVTVNQFGNVVNVQRRFNNFNFNNRFNRFAFNNNRFNNNRFNQFNRGSFIRINGVLVRIR